MKIYLQIVKCVPQFLIGILLVVQTQTQTATATVTPEHEIDLENDIDDTPDMDEADPLSMPQGSSMNSVLQILFHTREFRQALYNWNPSSLRTKISKVTGSLIDVIDCNQNVVLALQTIFARMENLSEDERGPFVRTIPLIKALQKMGWDPNDPGQSLDDPFQFFYKLLNIMGPLVNGTNQNFEGTLKDFAGANKIEDQKTILKTFKNIPIDLDLLDLTEIMRQKVNWKLEEKLYKKTIFFTFPPVLVFNLNVPGRKSHKNSRKGHFVFPKKLNLADFLPETKEVKGEMMWRLQTIVTRGGSEVLKGLEINQNFVYVDTHPNLEGAWLKFDDIKVEPVNSKMVLSQGNLGGNFDGEIVHLLVYREAAPQEVELSMPNNLPRNIKDFGVAMPCDGPSGGGGGGKKKTEL